MLITNMRCYLLQNVLILPVIDSDYDVALKYLNQQNGLSIVDYKLYHPDLLRDDTFIKQYQTIYCDFGDGKLKIYLKEKMSKKIEEMKRND